MAGKTKSRFQQAADRLVSSNPKYSRLVSALSDLRLRNSKAEQPPAISDEEFARGWAQDLLDEWTKIRGASDFVGMSPGAMRESVNKNLSILPNDEQRRIRSAASKLLREENGRVMRSRLRDNGKFPQPGSFAFFWDSYKDKAKDAYVDTPKAWYSSAKDKGSRLAKSVRDYILPDDAPPPPAKVDSNVPARAAKEGPGLLDRLSSWYKGLSPRSKNIGIGLLAAGLLAGGGYYGYKKYQESQARKKRKDSDRDMIERYLRQMNG